MTDVIIVFESGNNSRLANCLVYLESLLFFAWQSRRSICFPFLETALGDLFAITGRGCLKKTSDLFFQSPDSLQAKLMLLHQKIKSDATVERLSLSRIKEYEISSCANLFVPDIDYNGCADVSEIELSLDVKKYVVFSRLFPLKAPRRMPVSAEITVNLSLLDSAWRDVLNCSLRPDGVIRIGIHARRCDYARWKNGKHFYSASQYGRLIAALYSICETRVQFFLFSDEEGFAAELPCEGKHINIVYPRLSSDLDFLVLGSMNAIFGPPSTFSLMSARVVATLLDKQAASVFHIEEIESYISQLSGYGSILELISSRVRH